MIALLLKFVVLFYRESTKIDFHSKKIPVHPVCSMFLTPTNLQESMSFQIFIFNLASFFLFIFFLIFQIMIHNIDE